MPPAATPPSRPAALAAVAGPLLLAAAWSAWQGARLGRALRLGRSLAGRARPFAADPPRPAASVLLVGDSTGLGVGALDPRHSLPGLLAQRHPGLRIVNACRNGARVADGLRVVQALPPGTRFDVVLVLLGGNDVLRLAPLPALAQAAESLLRALRGVARHVAWLGCADIGRAPALLPPLSWWAGRHCSRRMQLLGAVASRHRVPFIDFCDRAHSERFGRRPQVYFAADGLHPSAASYRTCFEVLCRRVPLARWLAAPPLPATPDPPQENPP